ncbi:MAG: hypothetical protein E5Y67_12260 [Mesorhizobium sp.]|uniref:hypothetical protein n=1 Tax=Mesorhizobium sp. TaxID=1871066 RepID=UPI0012102E37|nr:hypothetical protein [Mesorhizobium sp.]TIM14446.1 MAG: hypothetical protein E5Y67_12260 [Mesorhizobium sp.]
MTIQEAILAVRSWRMKPEAVDILLAEFERMQREVQPVSDPDALAHALYRKADPTGIWVSEDQSTKNHYRRQAQQALRADKSLEPSELAK